MAHLVFRYIVYDGELLPNTFYAKRGGFWEFSPWHYIYKGLLTPVLGMGGFAAALTGFIYGRRQLPHVMPCVWVVALTGGLLPLLLGLDWMVGYRLMMPYLPAAAVMVAVGWVLLLSRLRWADLLVSSIIVGGITILLWFTQNEIRKSVLDDTLIRAKGYNTGHRAVAEWIRSHAKPGDSIALMDIGIIGYTCIDKIIIDITGLTDRYIGKSQGSFLKKNYDPNYIFNRQPRFIVLTFYADGQPYTVPAPGTPFHLWTTMESRLMKDAQFIKFYRHPPVFRSNQPLDWLDTFAAQVGAERAFEHGHPQTHCIQAVFYRQTTPVSADRNAP